MPKNLSKEVRNKIYGLLIGTITNGFVGYQIKKTITDKLKRKHKGKHGGHHNFPGVKCFAQNVKKCRAQKNFFYVLVFINKIDSF